MSEYQYHEWQTVDRVLTPEEQATVNDLSSHIEVSSSRAMVTYHWSDFRHDPKQVLLQYFDAYFYLANWGSLRLMFRFPKGLLDEADLSPYCMNEYITFYNHRWHEVLDPLYDKFQRWKAGEFDHADIDKAIYQTHKLTQELYGVFALKYEILARSIQLNEAWFQSWLKDNPPPAEYNLG